MKSNDKTELRYREPDGGTRPVIWLIYEADTEQGEDFLYVPHQPVGFLQLMDALYPEVIDASRTREGQFYSIFDRQGVFMGTCTARPVPHSGSFCMGSWRKNPFYQSEDRMAFLRAVLGVQAVGGLDIFRSWTKVTNYAVQKQWAVLGLGAKPVKGSSRLTTCGETPETKAELQRYLLMSKGAYGDIRAGADRRLAKIGEKDARAVLPDLDKMPHTEFTASVTL